MKKLLEILNEKPKLYEQTNKNMWEDEHISKGMLKAHLDETLNSATRNMKFVEKSVEWISSILPPENFKQILDLGCGPGIYTELFYKQGYEVTGIDISPRSIQYARKSANKKGLLIEYILGDYTNNEFVSKYDLITLIYCDFGVLPSNIRHDLLHKIYDALRTDGVLLFDVFTPLKYKNVAESKQWEINEHGFWHEKPYLLLHSFYRYEEEQTFLNQYTLITKDQEVAQYNVWEHTFTFLELEKDLRHVGFENFEFYENVIGDCRKDDGYTICVVARK